MKTVTWWLRGCGAICSELSNENDDGPGARRKDPRNDSETLSRKTTMFDSLDISSYATILPKTRRGFYLNGEWPFPGVRTGWQKKKWMKIANIDASSSNGTRKKRRILNDFVVTITGWTDSKCFGILKYSNTGHVSTWARGTVFLVTNDVTDVESTSM